MVFSSPGINLSTGDDIYIRDELAADNSVWSICSWHKNQNAMQVGSKPNETGWGVYEECRIGGGIIATGHEHSYSRTHLLDNMQTQSIYSESPNVIIDKGKTFAFVSGLGGQSIRPQSLSGDWWASIYTSTQGADHGALFCEFNVDGQPDKASCYFKDIQNNVVDQFDIYSRVEPTEDLVSPTASFVPPTPADTAVTQTVEIQADITEANLSSVSHDWDGTVFDALSSDVALMYNFDNVLSIGEDYTTPCGTIHDASEYKNDG